MSSWGRPAPKLKHGTLKHKLVMGGFALILFLLFSQWWFALPVAIIAFILAALTGSTFAHGL